MSGLRDQPIDPKVDIGHVHLKVSDLERALDFYCGVLGFRVRQRYGTEAAFIAAGDYHHHIGLNTWESRGELAMVTRLLDLDSLLAEPPDRAGEG